MTIEVLLRHTLVKMRVHLGTLYPNMCHSFTDLTGLTNEEMLDLVDRYRRLILEECASLTLETQVRSLGFVKGVTEVMIQIKSALEKASKT